MSDGDLGCRTVSYRDLFKSAFVDALVFGLTDDKLI
jgi:hypothetical protein